MHVCVCVHECMWVVCVCGCVCLSVLLGMLMQLFYACEDLCLPMLLFMQERMHMRTGKCFSVQHFTYYHLY